MGSAGAAVWRPRLWVRIAAIALPLGLAAALVFPQALNPDWAQGMPRDEVGWLFGFIAFALLLVWCALRSRIEVGAGEVLVVNPWGTRRMATTDVEEVRPGPSGVELLDSRGPKIVGFAVQATEVFLGTRPRWVDG